MWTIRVITAGGLLREFRHVETRAMNYFVQCFNRVNWTIYVELE